MRYENGKIDVVSEVAPLPGFSAESIEQVSAFLTSNRKPITSFFDQDYTATQLRDWVHSISKFPSVQFGLSSLGLSVLSIRMSESINTILNYKSTDSIKMNAVLGKSDAKSFMAQAIRHINNGFSVLKCKVSANPGHLPESLQELIGQFPDVTFRLDANRSWPVARVQTLSSLFQNLPIEYIEEPCPVESIEQFLHVSTICTIPIAADETIAKYGLKTLLESADSIPYLIIKPTLHGSLMDLFATITPRNPLEDRVIYTTALESAVGTRMIAAAAAMTGNKTLAHGLNTGSLFQYDLASENGLHNGTFNMQPHSKCWFTFQEINQTFITPVR